MEPENNNQDLQKEDLKKQEGQEAAQNSGMQDTGDEIKSESGGEDTGTESGDTGAQKSGRGRESGEKKYHQNNRRQNYRKKNQGKSDETAVEGSASDENVPESVTGNSENKNSEEKFTAESLSDEQAAVEKTDSVAEKPHRKTSGYDPHKVIIEGLDKYFDDRDKSGTPKKADDSAEKEDYYVGKDDDEVLPEKPAPPIVIRTQEPKPVDIISKKEQLLKSLQSTQPKQPEEVPEVHGTNEILPPPPPLMRATEVSQKEQVSETRTESVPQAAPESRPPVQEKPQTQERPQNQEKNQQQEKPQGQDRNQNQNQGQSQNYGNKNEKRDNRDNRDGRDNRNKRVKDLRKLPNHQQQQQQNFKGQQQQERPQEKKEPQFQPPPPQRFRTSFRKISIVIPLFNEEEAIPPLTMEIKNVLREQNLNAEVIFVDDGSTDKSLRLIKDICRTDNRFRYVSFQKNYGKSAALNVGFHNVKGDVVITMDDDLQDDPKEIPALLKKLEEGYDLVSGWKKKRFDPFIKKYTSKIFNSVTSLMSGIKLHDFNCGLKAYKRYVADDLRIYGEMHRYIPILAHWRGYSVTEIPVKHHPRRYGVTKFGASRFFKGFVDLLTVMFITRYIKRPMHLFGFLGALSFMIGLVVNGYLSWLWIHGVPLSNRPLLLFGMLLMIVGVQFFTTGLLGELMVHNFQTDKEYNIKDTNIQGS